MAVHLPGERLTVYIGEDELVDHTPLSTAIIQRAHAAGLAGVTVVRGIAGYGASNHIHTTKILSLSEDLPVIISIVDTTEQIATFLASIIDLIEHGLVTIDDVHVVRYLGRSAETR
jgi:PII-like signaling protein